jgi:hypothetical protein
MPREGSPSTHTTCPNFPSQLYGTTRGLYFTSAGTQLSTSSDLSITVNFQPYARISGSATNFKFLDANGALVPRPEVSALNFDARLDISSSRFSGQVTTQGSEAMRGTFQGNFYGPAAATPEELGFAYSVGTQGTGPAMIGAGVAGRTP